MKKKELLNKADELIANKKKAKKTVMSWKFRLLAILIGILGACSIMFWCFMTISKWYDEHEVKFHAPIEIKTFRVINIAKREKQAQNGRSTLKFEASKPLWEDEEFMTNMYELTRYFESHFGQNKNDPTALHIYCQNQGKINEIGWSPQEKICFNSYWEQEKAYKNWLTKRLRDDKMTVIEATCYYVNGIKGQVQCLRSMDMNL
jgi:hypothetical protein